MPLPPVIFEDDALIAFDKPSGLTVVPERRESTHENLMDLVHAKFGAGVATVHRLDADTSGVLLCAKHKPVLDFVSGQFQSKTVRNVYHAFVVLPPEPVMKSLPPMRDATGALPEVFAIDLALGEDEQHKGRMRVCKGRGGKACTTAVRALARFGRFAFVECRPSTGRTHQVRVHLAAAGAPVLNDPFYGVPEMKLMLSDMKRRYKGRDEEKPLITRLALHVSEILLTHPVTREPFTLRAPLPHEFEVALKYLRKFVPGADRPGR